ncbi:hypothetical protein [Sorangium sp. So ce1024]|uniref:hypothetical protein n=2 Tax=unclassified Sorangium TaxID=2621164 RepID=UPI003EFD5E58
MGMFDWYTPVPPLACPRCRATLDGWQGKDGPCGLFEWVQGVPSPPRQHVDEECALSAPDRERFRLPERFEIYTDCEQCSAWIEAEGSCEGDVWSRVELVSCSAAARSP